MAASREEEEDNQSYFEAELEREGQDEYYALLNVPKTATSEEIRSAYRRLCKIYHPDRYQDSDKQQVATRFFKRIQEAYTILSDTRLRSVYDIRGKRGVVDDRALIERTALPTELLEEYEKLKLLFEERTYIQEVNPQGLYQLSLDASNLVTRQNGSPIKLTNAYAQQSVSANINKYSSTGLTGSLLASRKGIYTGLQGSFKQQLTNHNWYKVNGTLGHFPSLGLDLYRNITDNMYVKGESVLQWTPSGMGVALNGSIAQKLDAKTTAMINVKESGNSVGVSLSCQINEKVAVATTVAVGYRSSHIQLSLKGKPLVGYHTSISGRLSTEGPSLCYGFDHDIATLTQVGGQVIASFSTGIELKLRLVRASMNYVIKIQLSPSLHLPAIIYATLLPVGLLACIKGLALGPLLRYSKTQENEEKKMEREKEMKERKREAESAIDLMTETVQRILTTEQSRHGLIIIEGWYGSLYSTTSNDPLGPVKVIDVRIPLQCLVSDSKLVLRESTKSVIPGFYDPCIGDKKYLRVKYRFRGILHEVTVENNESLIIPRQSHKIQSNEE